MHTHTQHTQVLLSTLDQRAHAALKAAHLSATTKRQQSSQTDDDSSVDSLTRLMGMLTTFFMFSYEPAPQHMAIYMTRLEVSWRGGGGG